MNRLEVKLDATLLASGAFLILLGAIHVVVQLFEPRAWESNIGWRKPILFGLSTGITLISLSWVATVVRQRLGRKIIAVLISVLAVSEVLIITVQTWRNVPAHFNNGALIDQILANSIDAMLVFITLSIFYLTRQSLREQTIESDWLLSLRLGMIGLSIACLLGFGVAIYGNLTLGAGGDPTIVNPNGVPKFVHGMPLHALQILPGAVFFLRLFETSINNRKKSVWFIALAIALATFYAFWQTINGMGRFELNSGGLILFGGCVLCVLTALFFALPQKSVH